MHTRHWTSLRGVSWRCAATGMLLLVAWCSHGACAADRSTPPERADCPPSPRPRPSPCICPNPTKVRACYCGLRGSTGCSRGAQRVLRHLAWVGPSPCDAVNIGMIEIFILVLWFCTGITKTMDKAVPQIWAKASVFAAVASSSLLPGTAPGGAGGCCGQHPGCACVNTLGGCQYA